MIERKILSNCRKSQGLFGSVVDEYECVWYVMAALRINGVVKPQQRPTMRKDRM